MLSIFGTRPEDMKMDLVIQALEQREAEVESRIFVLTQHRQKPDQVLDLLQIKPDYNLNILRREQSLDGVFG